MRDSKLRLTLPCLAAAFMFAVFSSAHAQDLDDGTIVGVVTDETGARIPGAQIIAEVTEGVAPPRIARTNAGGEYSFPELSPGKYKLRALFHNFAPTEIEGANVAAGRRQTINLTLSLTGVSATQIVTDESPSPSIDVSRTLVGDSVTREEIESLPTSDRAPLELIFLLPGVTEEPLSTRDLAEDRDRFARRPPEEVGLFALSGGAAYSNNITIDGSDNNDDRAARERFEPSLEAVEEVQVVANQFSAEYGRASGGRVNLSTRRGAADRFHGRAFYFFRDEALNPDPTLPKQKGGVNV